MPTLPAPCPRPQVPPAHQFPVPAVRAVALDQARGAGLSAPGSLGAHVLLAVSAAAGLGGRAAGPPLGAPGSEAKGGAWVLWEGPGSEDGVTNPVAPLAQAV